MSGWVQESSRMDSAIHRDAEVETVQASAPANNRTKRVPRTSLMDRLSEGIRPILPQHFWVLLARVGVIQVDSPILATAPNQPKQKALTEPCRRSIVRADERKFRSPRRLTVRPAAYPKQDQGPNTRAQSPNPGLQTALQLEQLMPTRSSRQSLLHSSISPAERGCVA